MNEENWSLIKLKNLLKALNLVHGKTSTGIRLRLL